MTDILFEEYSNAKDFLYSLVHIPTDEERGNLITKQEYKEYYLGDEVFKIVTRRAYDLDKIKGYIHDLGIDNSKIFFIHVTGTSGKGSLVTEIHNSLVRRGYTVGSYIKPHIVTPLERYRVNGSLASISDFLWAFEKIKIYHEKLCETGTGLPYFAFLFLIALLIFQKNGVRFAVVEAGVGGLHDYTNVLNASIAVITNISHDHERLLGPTLRHIAFNKAGIITQGAEVVSGVSESDLQDLIYTYAKEQNAKVHFVRECEGDESHLLATKVLTLLEEKGKIAAGQPKIHQLGISNPARLEIISSYPTIILDSAHNEAKMHWLSKNIHAMKKEKKGRVIILFGLISTKDIDPILRQLMTFGDLFITTETDQISGKKFFSAKELEAHVRTFGKEVYAIPAPKTALEYGMKLLNAEDILVCTGSMYLLGILRSYWESERNFLERNSITAHN